MKTIKILKAAYLFFAAMLLSLHGFSEEHVTMSLKNITSTSNTIEYDLYIVNDGSTALKLSACSYGINFNGEILNGGKLTYSYLSNSKDKSLNALSAFSLATSKAVGSHHLQMTTTSVRVENAPSLFPNIQYKVGRFKITNSNEWNMNSNPSLSHQESTKVGLTTTQILAFIGDNQLSKALTPTLKTVATSVEASPFLNEQIENSIRSKNGLSSLGQDVIKIYPNPVVDELKIDLFAKSKGVVNFKISDIQGRLVKQVQTNAVEGLNKIVINMSEFAKGIYNVKIVDVNELNYTQTFSKQ